MGDVVTLFPHTNPADAPAMLRALALELEARQDVAGVVIVLERLDDGFDARHYGTALNRSALVGILERVKLAVAVAVR